MEFGHLISEKTRFSELAANCICLSSSNSEEDRRKAIDILDQLNGFNYHHHIAFDARQVSRLIQSSTRLVHPTDKTNTAKVVKLVLSLVHRQGISLSSDTSDEVIRWMARVLHHQEDTEGKAETLVLLQTLAALLIEAGEQTDEVYIELAGDKGCLTMFCDEDTPWNIRLAAIQCLHHLTYLPSSILVEAWQNGEDIFPPRMVQIVQGVLVKLLQQSLRQQEKQDCTTKMYLQITAAALGVLYNLVVCSPNEILDNILINTCRPYMFFGLPGFLHQDMLKNTIPALVDIPSTTGTESDTSSRSYTNRNRRKRLRRKKAQPSLSQSKSEVPLASSSSFSGAPSLTVLRTPEAAPTFKPAWASKALDSSDGEQAAKRDHAVEEVQPTSSSDMESSDPDGGGLGGEISSEKESSLSAKVRKCALQTINAVIKKVGKQNKFSYWPTLMCQNPSLMTCTLKDPSVGVRMEALQVINTFLLDSSQLLMLAVDDEGKSAYTTFGHQLGSSIRELHRCLALILLSEKLQGALVPTLKTIELLVENVNYSKLKPGLLTKLVTHVKYFMRHEAVLVKANAFSVMVSVLMIKPQVQELHDLLTRYQTRLSTPLKGSPPSVVAQPSEPMDEMFPEDEELLAEFESTTISSENESDREEKSYEKNTVSWLIQRCVDSLITPDNEAVRGFYIQVQLQSLKVLSCLCSEHLPLIKDCIGLIQKVIYICTTTTSSDSSSSQSTPQDYPHHPKPFGDGQRGVDGMRSEADTYLMSSDHGVIAEHSFSLLGTLLESLKEEVNKGEQGSFTVQQQQQLWLWALQGPLQYLLSKAQASTVTVEQEAAAVGLAPSWFQINEGSGSVQGNTSAVADDKNAIPGTSDRHAVASVGSKQLIAAAVVLSHLNSEIFESLGDDWMSQLLTAILWLVKHSDPDLSLAGVRVMAVVVSFPAVISHPKGITVLQETTKATTNILRQKESNVNKDRHLAAWALANISSVLDQYRESWEVCKGQSKNEYVLPLWLLCAVVEVGVQACSDKDKIKPHGVRCVGNIIKHLSHAQVLDPKVMPLLNGAVEVLLKSVSTGKSMKTRWNACYALGNILSSDNLPLSEMAWRSKVIITLASLVENCKHYKVSIQACSAVCSLTSRQEYGKQYLVVWQALFQGLDRAQNIADYHEIRHREELINQICQGICQLTCLLTLEDATSTLYELLLVHQDTTQAYMARAHEALPPERAAQAIHAHMHVGTLLTQSDALTDVQEGTLNVLLTLTENV